MWTSLDFSFYTTLERDGSYFEGDNKEGTSLEKAKPKRGGDSM